MMHVKLMEINYKQHTNLRNKWVLMTLKSLDQNHQWTDEEVVPQMEDNLKSLIPVDLKRFEPHQMILLKRSTSPSQGLQG